MKLALELPGTPPYSSEVFIDGDEGGEFFATLASCLKDRVAYWIWDERGFCALARTAESIFLSRHRTPPSHSLPRLGSQ